MNLFFYFPDLTFGTTSVGRRIHNDSVVKITALDFPLHKFFAVVHDIAARRIPAAGQRHIVLCRLHHPARRVHVAYRSTCRRRRHRSPARIREQVQHAHLTTGSHRATDQPVRPVPVCRLLREQPRMLEAHRTEPERVVPVVDAPVLRHPVHDPLPAAADPSVHAVRLPPSRVTPLALPDHLRVRAHQNILPPPLQPLSAFRIDQLILLPLIGTPHFTLHLHDLNGKRWERGTGGRGERSLLKKLRKTFI